MLKGHSQITNYYSFTCPILLKELIVIAHFLYCNPIFLHIVQFSSHFRRTGWFLPIGERLRPHLLSHPICIVHARKQRNMILIIIKHQLRYRNSIHKPFLQSLTKVPCVFLNFIKGDWASLGCMELLWLILYLSGVAAGAVAIIGPSAVA